MRWKQIEDEPKVFALIFETGDEIASVLQEFARGQGLAESSFKARFRLTFAVDMLARCNDAFYVARLLGVRYWGVMKRFLAYGEKMPISKADKS